MPACLKSNFGLHDWNRWCSSHEGGWPRRTVSFKAMAITSFMCRFQMKIPPRCLSGSHNELWVYTWETPTYIALMFSAVKHGHEDIPPHTRSVMHAQMYTSSYHHRKYCKSFTFLPQIKEPVPFHQIPCHFCRFLHPKTPIHHCSPYVYFTDSGTRSGSQSHHNETSVQPPKFKPSACRRLS